MITDGAYGSQENQRLAERKNTELITTALTGKPVDKFYAEFQFSEDGTKMLICPMGYVPLKTTYYPKTGMCRALFQKTAVRTVHTKTIAKASHRKRTMRFTPQPAWYPEHDIRKSYPLQSTSN